MSGERRSTAPAQTAVVEELYLACNRAQATAWNTMQMAGGRASFAYHVALSLSDFAAKLWEQEGDGRLFASNTSIILAAEAALQRNQFKHLQLTRSLSQTLYVCLREGVGVPAFDAALEEAWRCAQGAGVQSANGKDRFGSEMADEPLGALTPAEREAVWVLAQTEELLAERNLVLEGRALALLAARHDEVFCKPIHITLVGGERPSARWQAFFDACPELDVRFDERISDEPLSRREDARVRLALSSGHYAQAQIVLDVIADVCEHNPDAHFIVTSADALALYERIAPPLQQAGLSCSVESSAQLAYTDFGRMFFSVRDADARGYDWDKAALTDALVSAFSGVRKDKAWAWDKRVRGDRLLQFDELREDVKRSSMLLSALLDGAFDAALLAKISNRLRAQGFSEAYIREQLMAAQGLISIAQEACDFGLFDSLGARQAHAAHAADAAHDGQNRHDGYGDHNDHDDHDDHDSHDGRIVPQDADCARLDFIWELARIPIHRVSLPKAHVQSNNQDKACLGVLPRLRIMDMRRASQLAPHSTDVVIACDLTSENYALKESNSTAHMLLERLGVHSNEGVLARERRIFSKLAALPAHLLVCERPLNDENADPLYPSAMLEEFMAAYRAPGEELGSSGIPQALMAGLYERGEEHLLEDVQPVFRGRAVHSTPQRAVRRDNLGASGQLLVPRSADQAHKHALRLSPSQIETYLECPYRWFAERRLGADGLDEGLDASRKGSFFHEVFKTFYERFGQKVTPGNLNAARALMFGETGSAPANAGAGAGAGIGTSTGAGIGTSTGAGTRAKADADISAGGIFAELVAAQYAYDEAGHPHANRYVVRPNTSEEFELNELKARVSEWLVFETAFLPSFTPKAFEFAIEGALYQGCEIKGFIDRIDVDACGRAVIIDYKGSLQDAHQALVHDAYNATGKIQALLYASLIQDIYADELGIKQVVGALYLSYKQGNALSGAFDQTALDIKDMPTLQRGKNCGLPPKGVVSFEGLRAFTNERIAQAVSSIAAGQVAPGPAQAQTKAQTKACLYCPVLACEKRAG